MFDQGLSHAPATVYVGGPRGSPKPTWRWCWYSGAKSWADLVVWAHRPPMGVYRTALVPVLSHAHGRGWGRLYCPCKQEVISATLTPFLCRGFLPRTPCWPGTVRRLPRPSPWSPGDDRWLPGTAGARGRCASVTLRRDSTDLRKFCSAGGQADGSPIKSFKIGKHWSQFVRSGSFAGSEVLTYSLRPEPNGF